MPGMRLAAKARAHLTIGVAVPIFMLWGVACLAMLITRKASSAAPGV